MNVLFYPSATLITDINMAFIVKRIENEDEVKGKALVHWSSWREAYRGIVDQGYLDSLLLPDFEKRTYGAIDNALIAKDGERVVGFVYYSEYRGEDLKDYGEVTALYVSSDYYGRGAGYNLMKAALEQLKMYPNVALWVIKDNVRARKFYERCGFCYDGAEKITTLGFPVVEVRMIKQNV